MGEGEVTLTNIGKDEMEEILEDYEQGGREDSGYVVMDVREEHEIAFTGKLSESTITFPLQKIAQYDAFALPADEFEEIYGFEKPDPDESESRSVPISIISTRDQCKDLILNIVPYLLPCENYPCPALVFSCAAGIRSEWTHA